MSNYIYLVIYIKPLLKAYNYYYCISNPCEWFSYNANTCNDISKEDLEKNFDEIFSKLHKFNNLLEILEYVLRHNVEFHEDFHDKVLRVSFENKSVEILGSCADVLMDYVKGLENI